jgi:hypothetical protein
METTTYHAVFTESQELVAHTHYKLDAPQQFRIPLILSCSDFRIRRMLYNRRPCLSSDNHRSSEQPSMPLFLDRHNLFQMATSEGYA